MDSDAWDKSIDVTAIQNGDRKAFRSVIDMYYGEIYLYARSLSRDEILAKDLVQEGFYKLWKKRKKIKNITSLRGWLYKSVRNKFIDYARKHRKEVYFFEMNYAGLIDDIVQEDYLDDLKRKVKIAEKEIARLPKKCQKVFVLSKKEGLTNNEIAEHLGISVKTVEGHLTNAIKILKERLKERR